MIYLDNAATTWPKPEIVYQTVNACIHNIGGSPGRGGHAMARAAGSVISEAREEIAYLFGGYNSDNVIFTANATEAINIVLQGVLDHGDTVVTTAMEHNAVARTLRYLEMTKGIRIITIPLQKEEGALDLSILQTVDVPVKAVVVNHASNVTGVLAPLDQLTAWAKQKGALFILDASQSAGVENINVEKMKIDFLACSGHKGLLGPQGTGVLYINCDYLVRPLKFGGTGSLSEYDLQPDFLPDALESGTPNTLGVAGLLSGVRFIREIGVDNIRRHEQELLSMLLNGLRAIEKVKIYGHKNGTHVPVVSFNIHGVDGGMIAHLLDKEYQIACRSGLHCAPWAHAAVGTLKTGTVRMSPGYFNTAQDIKAVLEAVSRLAN